jgi:hypothetical protein
VNDNKLSPRSKAVTRGVIETDAREEEAADFGNAPSAVAADISCNTARKMKVKRKNV